MGSKNQHKNINADTASIHIQSGSSASTSSKQVSKASKKAKVIDDDSDSEIFGDIGGRGSCEKRLGAEFFNTEKKVLVLFGDIYSDKEKNIEITWETEPIIAAIVWSKSCNDKKQAGICVDDTGFAGWDIKHKVYLTYNSPITANKFCMKIVNLTPPEPVEPDPTDFSSLMSEDDSADSKPSKKLCSYSFTKGKNKGEVCGKSVNGESDYCKTHSKTGAKQKGISPDIVTAITLALKEILSKDSTPLVALTEIIKKLESPEAQSLLSDILKTPSKQPKSSSDSDSDSESESKTEKKRKVKKEKDPDAPKRPLTPYILFCMEKRDTVKTDNPSMGGKEITTELGKLWKELTDDEKDIYKKKYQEDKVRYASELSNYESPDESPTEKKTVKKSNKKTGPKRGLSSYIFFCQENRAVVKTDEPDFDAKEVTRELGRRWSTLSDTDKEPFIKLAEADKVRYEKEQSDEDTEPEKIKPSPKKTTKPEPAPPKQKKADSQKTKGTDGFTQFVLQNRESCLSSNPTLKPPAIMNKLQELWDDMDDEEKLNYNK